MPLNLQVGASGDDSHQQSIPNDSGRNVTGSGICSLTNTKLEIGSHSGGNEWSAAAAFVLNVAQGETITEAIVSLRGNSSYSASPNVVKIYASVQDSDAPAALSSSSADLNAAARPRTTATTVLDVSSVTGGTWYEWDITTAVQELVDRAGWSSGNRCVVLFDTHEDTTVGEWQDFDSYDGSAAGAPKLDVTYGSGGGTTYTETGGIVAGAVASGLDTLTGVDAGTGVAGAVMAGAGVMAVTETGAAIAGTVMAGDAAAQYTDTGAGVVGAVFSGLEQVITLYTETGAMVAGLVTSGSDVLAGVDTGAAVAGYVVTGGEVATGTDTGAMVAGAVFAGADVLAGVDAGAYVLGTVFSGADAYSGGGTTYTEAGSFVAGLDASGADVWVMVDGGYSVAGAVAAGDGQAVYADTGAAVAGTVMGGDAQAGYTDTGSGLAGGLFAGLDVALGVDSGYSVMGAEMSGDVLTITIGEAAYTDRLRGMGSGSLVDPADALRDRTERLAVAVEAVGTIGERLR